ncbi:MAG: molybdopterin-binding/glycosyltransferase family 2 protein [Emcibacter sp.]|nr:molybdopterin-binding/glycosyltransferase family 2 protein [Emcibacter sp.]
MKFGEFPLSEILGGTLAHSVLLPSGRLKKGHILSETDILELADNNITHVMTAILEPDEMTEDEVATRISAHISGDNITCADAFTGRVNLYAAKDGLAGIKEQAVNALNHIDEAITLATIAPNTIVTKGQMIATVKIIPLAVSRAAVEKVVAEIESGLITLYPFQPQNVVMIQTELSGSTDKLFEKAKRVMTHRLDVFNATLIDEVRCPHEETGLAETLRKKAAQGPDIILILGASAITDRRDVIPAAIVRAGGEVMHYGMPVDPGNLMLLGKMNGKWVLGLPGCSRSPKLNGIDLILSRIAAGQNVTAADIMGMGVGGLLSEYAGRPQPRELTRSTQKKPNIAALILAAGQSTRMGERNKLLLPYEDTTVLSHVLNQVKQAEIDDIYVVTGHQKEKIEPAVNSHEVTFLHNDLYAEGMSTSVKLGIGSLPDDVAAVLIILGDMPNISADILRQLMVEYEAGQDQAIIIPTHNGKRGNPILWGRVLFNEFERLEGDMGAKILLSEYAEYIHEVEVGSDAIFLDIDTYEAYERLRKT